MGITRKSNLIFFINKMKYLVSIGVLSAAILAKGPPADWEPETAPPQDNSEKYMYDGEYDFGDSKDENYPSNFELDEDICKQPPVIPSPYSCMALMPRAYYDGKTNACRTFYYYGCNGTDNLFETFQECQDACGNEET